MVSQVQKGTANRVVFNTFIQYVQLILSVLIGLISVRLVLSSLGESDYGLYNLVGGVVSFLSFINSSLSQTSIRFISLNMGSGDVAKTRSAFSSCLQLHILLGIGLAIVLELAGLLLFNGFLNINSDRVGTAKALYHFMIFTLLLTTVATPFRALIISKERFLYVSLLGLFNSLCKFGIAVFLISASGDKLLLYGLLIAAITAIDFLFYLLYNIIQNKQYLYLKWESLSVLSSVASFAGWTLLDVLGTVVNRQGYAIMLNVFFGTIVNAAYAIGNQVACHLYDISASVIDAMKPQIIKSQGAGNSSRMLRLSMTAGKFGFSMMSLLAIPFIVMMPDILELWLKDVPSGSCLFARLLIIASLCEQLTRGLVYANQAIGNIKWFSIIVSGARMLALPISCLFLSFKAPAYIAFYVFIVCECLGSLCRVYMMKRIAGLSIESFVKTVLLPIIVPFSTSLILCILLYDISSSLLWLAFLCVLSASVYALLLYWLGLTHEEKLTVNSVVYSMKNRLIRR